MPSGSVAKPISSGISSADPTTTTSVQASAIQKVRITQSTCEAIQVPRTLSRWM